MKVITSQLTPRITYPENKQLGIINYDNDNLYPQNLDMIFGGSGTATSCLNVFSKFIKGEGFEDGNKIVVKDFGYDKITLLDLLGSVAKDFAKYDGFAIHINYNAKFKIRSMELIPFGYCRLGRPDNNLYVGKIVVYTNWDRKKPRGRVEPKKFDVIDRFNPDPAVIAKQVEKAGGWRKYKGQVLWASRAGIHTYPRSAFDPVLEDVETDSMIKTAKYKGIMNNFSAGHMFVHRGKFDTDEEKDKFARNLNSFQGADNKGSVMLVEVEYDEQAPEIEAFQSNEPAEQYKYTEKSIQDNIRKMVAIPPVLIGDLVVGRLGTAEEIFDATNLYNIFTLDERQYVTSNLEKLFPYFEGYEDTNLDIVPVSIYTEEDILERLHATSAANTKTDTKPEEDEPDTD